MLKIAFNSLEIPRHKLLGMTCYLIGSHLVMVTHKDIKPTHLLVILMSEPQAKEEESQMLQPAFAF